MRLFGPGLKPLLCDIDLETWLPDANAEDDLLDRRKSEIAALVPYATFGAGLDLDRYAKLAERRKLALVIDAAASLGSLEDNFGAGFGAGFTGRSSSQCMSPRPSRVRRRVSCTAATGASIDRIPHHVEFRIWRTTARHDAGPERQVE